MNNKPIRYIVYARKSSESEDRQVQSIDYQLSAIRKMVETNKLKVIDTLTEAKSAKAPGRPQFTKLMERINAGEADGIIAWNVSRLCRNPVDGGALQWALDNQVIREIRTPDRTFRPEDSSYIWSVETAGTSQFIKDLKKGVREGLSKKVAAGWRPGAVPHGYKNTKFQERGTNYIIRDDDTWPVIRKAWDMMLTGTYAVSEIQEVLSEEMGFRTRKTKRRGGVRISKGGMYRILTNPFYAGWLIYQGTEKKGVHDPMITDNEYDRVQVLLGRYGRPRPQRYEYAYPGAIKCGECGGFVSATFKEKKIKRTGEVKTYTLYYCTTARRKPQSCTQRSYTNLEIVENAIQQELSTLSLLPEFRDWAIELIDEMDGEEHSAKEAVLNGHKKSIAAVERKLEALMSMRLNGLIDDDEYLVQKNGLKRESSDLSVLLEKESSSHVDVQKLTRETFDFAFYAQVAFERGDAKTRREILEGLSGLNCTLKDQIVSIQAVEWLLPIRENATTLSRGFEAFEPELARTYGTENAFEHFRPVLRGRRDLNPRSPP